MGSSVEETMSQPKAMEEEEETYSYAMQLSMSIALPMAMKAAIELGVFEIIAKAGPVAKLSASEIVADLPTSNPEVAPMMLDRILRLLVTYDVLRCFVSADGVRLYSLASVSKYFVPNEDGVSLAPLMALTHDNAYWNCWSEMKLAILEGVTPFSKMHDMTVYEYCGNNPRFNDVINKAMFDHTTIVMKRILESYNGFGYGLHGSDLTQLVDVGGGMGVTINMITSKYPYIKGVNFDLPHVIQNAPSYPRVTHISGDMFESIPKGDAILMKWILHNWNDDHCLRLLRNCYNAILDNGKVIVIDAVVSTVPQSSVAAKEASLMDVVMLTQLPEGKERTKQEFMALASRAGFRGINFKCCVLNFHMMEFFK